MIFELVPDPVNSASYLITKDEYEAESLASMIQAAFPNQLIGIACYRGYYDCILIPST